MSGIINSTGARSGVIGTTVGTPAGSYTKIGQANFADASTVELGQTLGTGYRVHKLFFTCACDSGSAGRQLYLRFKVGSSWITSGNKYSYVYWGYSSASVDGNIPAVTQNNWNYHRMTRDGLSMGEDGMSAWELTFQNLTQKSGGSGPHSSGNLNWKTFWTHGGSSNHDSGEPFNATTSHGYFKDSGEVTDIRLYPTSDTIEGSWELYGIGGGYLG